HVRDRHVVVNLEGVVPARLAVECPGTEPPGSKDPGVLVDPARPALEVVATAEQAAVVIQIMYVDLETPRPDAIEKREGDRVSVLRYELERRLDSVAVVLIHQRGATVTPDRRLDVVRDDDTAWRAVRPEPHKGQPSDSLATERQPYQSLQDLLDRVVYRPSWKEEILPVAEIRSLERATQEGGQKAADGVVRGLPRRLAPRRVDAIGRVALESQVVDHLTGVEGHPDGRPVRDDLREGVMEPVDR